jgi:hypothetical protein
MGKRNPNGTKSSNGSFRVVGIRLDEDLSRALEKLADDSERSMGAYVRWLLRKHVRNRRERDD